MPYSHIPGVAGSQTLRLHDSQRQLRSRVSDHLMGILRGMHRVHVHVAACGLVVAQQHVGLLRFAISNWPMAICSLRFDQFVACCGWFVVCLQTVVGSPHLVGAARLVTCTSWSVTRDSWLMRACLLWLAHCCLHVVVDRWQ